MGRAVALIALLGACGPSEREAVDAPVAVVDVSATDAAIDVLGMTAVYANTPEALYRVNPDTLVVTKVHDFVFTTAPESITDIAIDQHGLMLGISNTAVYRIAPATAKVTLVSDSLTGGFNGLSFIPAAMIGESGDDVLIATRGDDGLVFRIDLTTGQATSIGDMGAFHSSGDLVAVKDVGITQITTGFLPAVGSTDRLVRLGFPGFVGTVAGPITGFNQVWGVAYWKSRIFAFAFTGQILELDPTNGKPTVVQSGGPEWFGAAVTTLAPIL